MYCSNCGKQIAENANFCSFCGSKVDIISSDSINKINVAFKKLKCKVCGGIMQVDEGKNVISCPYCGNADFMIESDHVRIEKHKIDSNKDISIEKVKSDKEVNLKKAEYDYMKNYSKAMAPMMIAVCIVLIFLYYFLYKSGMLAPAK